MSDQPHEDRGTAPAPVVAVMLAIIATGLIVLLYERAGQHPPGREALKLSFSSGELERLEQRRLVPDRSGALLCPSLPNR
jgi:hypothetical protein